MATPKITYRPPAPVYQRISPRSGTTSARVQNLLGRLDSEYGQRQNLAVLSRNLRLSSNPFSFPAVSRGLTPFQQTRTGISSDRGPSKLDTTSGQNTFARGFLGTGVFEPSEEEGRFHGQNVFQQIGTQIGEDILGLSPSTPTTPSTTTSIFQNVFSSIGDYFFNRRNSG